VEMWCVDTGLKPSRGRQKSLESYAIEGDSPVVVTLKVFTGAPEYLDLEMPSENAGLQPASLNIIRDR